MPAESLPFTSACRLLRQRIATFGIRLIRRDIPDPLTGDLNGVEIHIDHAVNPEQELFLLAHLFGHTVQWNTQAGAYELGQPRQPPVDVALLRILIAYEVEAARYGLALLEACRLPELTAWFSAYSAADQAYLEHFYRTGIRRPFESFFRPGAKLLTSLPIPPFTPRIRAFRADGVVI